MEQDHERTAFFFLMLAYAYDYRTEFKLSKLNLKLILGFFLL